MNQYILAKQEDFNKAINFFEKEIAQLRVGRANANLLNGIEVKVYGVRTPINGVANINIVDGQTILIVPWDKNNIKETERAIIEANLGVSTVNEGDKIRLTVPKMTEESRIELVKRLSEMMETARISLRQTRDYIKTEIEKAEKEKEISEDDKFRFLKELEEEVNQQNNKLKEVKEKKEKEIMTI